MFGIGNLFTLATIISTAVLLFLGFLSQQKNQSLIFSAIFVAILSALASNLFSTRYPVENWMLFIVSCVVVFNIGCVIGSFLHYKGNKKFLSWIILKFNLLFGSRPTKLVVVALLVSIFLTWAFSYTVNWKDEKGFMYGFYQSWTAGFVAFLVFGIAGIFVSVHRPSKEPFKQRVGNLFDVTDNQTIEHLSESIEKIGYYSVLSERTYKIRGYDRDRKAYDVMVTHKSKLRNFLHDVSTPDKLLFSLSVGEEDRLEPPLEVIGKLTKVWDGKKSLIPETELPIAIARDGISLEWDITIPEGAEADIEIISSCYYKIDVLHEHRPIRFAKRANVYLEYCVDTPLPSVSILQGNRNNTIKLEHGKPVLLDSVENCRPGERIIAFKISPPPDIPSLACQEQSKALC